MNPHNLDKYFPPVRLVILVMRDEKFKRDKSRIPGYQTLEYDLYSLCPFFSTVFIDQPDRLYLNDAEVHVWQT